MILRIIVFTMLPIWLGAQTWIGGQVVDNYDRPVTGVNVYLQGAYDGGSTDTDGFFGFASTEQDSQLLIASFLGFAEYKQWIILNGDTVTLKIELQESATELEAVTITAGAFEASDKKKAVILRPLDIVTTASAEGDIIGALQTLPGAQRVGEDGRLFVRGGAAYESRTFIDGLYVANPYSSSVPNLPSRGRFSPFLFKGTTFSTGGYSAEYGQALSSALLLETEDLPAEDLTSISLLSVGLMAARTERWDRSSLSISGEYTDLTPYVGLVDQNIEYLRAPYSLGGQISGRRQLGDQGILKGQAQYARSGFSLRYPDPEDIDRMQAVALDNQYAYFNGSLRSSVGHRWHLFAGLAGGLNTDRTRAGVFHNDEQGDHLIGKLRLDHDLNNGGLLRVGGEYWYENFRQEITVDTSLFYSSRPYPYAATFAEADWSLGKSWALRTGLRLDAAPQSGDLSISPRLSLAWRTGSNSQISLAAGRFVQRPEREVVLRTEDPGFEKAYHFLANWQYQHDRRVFRIEAYHKTYQELYHYANGDPNTARPTGKGYARGVDVFFRDRKSLPFTDYWISYSWLDTRRLFRDFPVMVQPPFASRHNFSAVIKHYIVDWQTQVGATFAYSSPRPYDDPNTAAFMDGRTMPYRDLSLNLSYLTSIWGHFTVVYFSCSNVPGFRQEFGRQYSLSPNEDGVYTSRTITPPAKRFLLLGVFLSLNKSSFMM